MFRSALKKTPNDIVLLSAVRSPITRAFKGGFRDSHPEDLLIPILQASLQRANISPDSVNDVLIGNVLAELGFAKTGRTALNAAGFNPTKTTFHTVNRQCSSSLQAITHIAHAIAVGQIEVGIAGGVESMSRNYNPARGIPRDVSPLLKECGVKDATDCLLPMLVTSENVAKRYGVGRTEQDQFAAESQRKAVVAQEEGRFSEIVPVRARRVSSETENETFEVVDRDDGVRQGVTVEKLAALKPVLEGGASTAGNSSQISDGASITILASRSWAESHGLRPIARFAGTQVAGCAPDEMGVGPIDAIKRLYKHSGVSQSDVDIFELNEAFASQSIHCIRELGIDMAKVNPNGGAIALGHPIGATGARQTATLLAELARSDKEVGLVSMCASTGMGVASLFIRE
ncbi:thiolase family protein [Aspergillus foveolatus]|uniref:thiolase family protein n=1 Tax=Aspergillus foveolatus TaxID=210207 RepID=UPI003CCE0BBC